VGSKLVAAVVSPPGGPESPALSESAGEGEIDDEVAETAPTVTVTVLASVTVTVAGPHAASFWTAASGFFSPSLVTGNGWPGTRDDWGSGAVLTIIGNASSAPSSVAPGMGTSVTTEIAIEPVPVGPLTVAFNWPYGATGAPVPEDPPVGMLATPRG
jgi:hypothetical protein